MRPRNLGCILLWFAFYAALSPRPAWAWGNDGHQVVAFIAADHLSTNARNHVAKILDADPSDPAALATKMADAAIRPDIEFRDRYPVTKPWHFVDLCLQDRESDIAKRFSGGGCVTEKIDEYADRLRKATYDQWGAYGDLAF